MSRLSEGQYAVTADAMQLVTRAENHLEDTFASLKNCKMHVDRDSFKHVQFYLDKIHNDLSRKLLSHIDAVDGKA